MSWFGKLFSTKEHECVCNTPSKNLSEASKGQHFKIKCLAGEEKLCQRLREMGFCESAVVEKIADSGTLICKVCDSKLVISKELAQHIIVKDICHLQGHDKSADGSQILLLSQMSLGQKGIIDNFVTDSDACERIEEMGVTPGEFVEIIRYAPLGDPIEIKIRGYSLSLRKQEADRIKVKILS